MTAEQRLIRRLANRLIALAKLGKMLPSSPMDAADLIAVVLPRLTDRKLIQALRDVLAVAHEGPDWCRMDFDPGWVEDIAEQCLADLAGQGVR